MLRLRRDPMGQARISYVHLVPYSFYRYYSSLSGLVLNVSASIPPLPPPAAAYSLCWETWLTYAPYTFENHFNSAYAQHTI